jgi:hypothetical protein
VPVPVPEEPELTLDGAPGAEGLVALGLVALGALPLVPPRMVSVDPLLPVVPLPPVVPGDAAGDCAFACALHAS